MNDSHLPFGVDIIYAFNCPKAMQLVAQLNFDATNPHPLPFFRDIGIISFTAA
jgi:hypothetical protein